MVPQLAVIVCKCPRLKNVYKSNGRCLEKIKSNNKENKIKSSVYTLHKIGCACTYSNGDFNNRGQWVPGWQEVPGLIFVYKTNEDVAGKYCPNNEMSLIEGVYTRLVLCEFV